MVELMVVIVIIGILATISIVHLTISNEKALDREVQSNLKLIASAEKLYRMEAGSYIACGNETLINSNLRLMIPTAATRKWNYTVSAPGGTTFSASGVRNGGTTPRTYYFNTTDDEAHL
jgi:type II secretory pathway pseudopilin PulG